MAYVSLTKAEGGVIYVNMDNVLFFQGGSDGQSTLTTNLLGKDGIPVKIRIAATPEELNARLHSVGNAGGGVVVRR